jgi:hypothetical protein
VVRGRRKEAKIREAKRRKKVIKIEIKEAEKGEGAGGGE